MYREVSTCKCKQSKGKHQQLGFSPGANKWSASSGLLYLFKGPVCEAECHLMARVYIANNYFMLAKTVAEEKHKCFVFFRKVTSLQTFSQPTFSLLYIHLLISMTNSSKCSAFHIPYILIYLAFFFLSSALPRCFGNRPGAFCLNRRPSKHVITRPSTPCGTFE